MDYPKLRYIEAFPVEVENGTRIYIRDPLNYAPEPSATASGDVFHCQSF